MLLKSRILLVFTIILFSVLITSCAGIPEKEISDAKRAIEEAEKINANKYASDQLTEAKIYLVTLNLVPDVSQIQMF